MWTRGLSAIRLHAGTCDLAMYLADYDSDEYAIGIAGSAGGQSV
jgi:hypothetical protein